MKHTYRDANGTQDLIDLVSSIDGNRMAMIEIGSAEGESAEIFHNTGKFDHIICIDPWSTEDHGYGNTYGGEKQEMIFDERTRGLNVIKFKGTIDTFIESEIFKKFSGKIDLVYIDGLHLYDACKNDILKTLNVIKPRIAISGHDFADEPYYILGVKKAVAEILGTPDKIFCNTSWIKFIKNIKQ